MLRLKPWLHCYAGQIMALLVHQGAEHRCSRASIVTASV